MRYYNIETDINVVVYNSQFILCDCKNKPCINTHICSVVCKRDCANFINCGDDDKGYWIECKYYTKKVRNKKLEQLNNEILQF